MSFQAYIDNIKAKTGKSPEDFKKLAEKKGLLKSPIKAGEIVAWLKKDFDLGHGHAMAIYAVFKSDAEPKPAKEDAIDKHFIGGKAHWRPAFDKLIARLKETCGDIQLAPTNSYISILNGDKKFAIVQVTADRMDIGIKLKNAEGTARFEPAGAWNATVTHRIKINDAKQIDKELVSWLHKAYEHVSEGSKKSKK